MLLAPRFSRRRGWSIDRVGFAAAKIPTGIGDMLSRPKEHFQVVRRGVGLRIAVIKPVIACDGN
jgi:hypothetical protein